MSERYTKRDLITFAAMSRLALAGSLGQHTAFAGSREYYTVLGYPTDITFDQYLQRYQRQDIAGRIVDLPARDSYKRPPRVVDGEKADTPFCEAWRELRDRLRVWSKLSRADRLSGIGQYGILVIGLRDGKPLSEPVEGILSGPDDVLYLHPYSEDKARIRSYVDDEQSERYGMPELYEIKPRDTGDWLPVHWTRVLHLAEGKADSEVFGTPRLQRVYNRLDDLIKLVGGTAEATWLNMRPGTLLSTKDEYDADSLADSDIEDEMERYAHDPLRMLYLAGIEAQQIGAGQVMDPQGPFEVCMSLLAAASGIPQRVLTGSAQGELAAAEWDYKQWAGEIRYRQGNYVEPEIVRPFLDRMIRFGVLPAPTDEYHLGEQDDNGEWHWPSLIDMTEEDMARVMQMKAASVSQLAGIPTGEMVTVEELRQMAGLPTEQNAGIATNAALRVARDNHTGGSLEDAVYRDFLLWELEELQ